MGEKHLHGLTKKFTCGPSGGGGGGGARAK